MRVVVLGASDKPDRYAYLALKRLVAAGHEPVPVNPSLDSIEGIPVVKRLADVPLPVDTVTVYVGPERFVPMIDGILALKPRRVIANPGTETRELAERAAGAGIEYLEACTLVLLGTGQF